MPYTTYANQKSIRIHKPAVSRDFLQIDNKEWMAVKRAKARFSRQKTPRAAESRKPEINSFGNPTGKSKNVGQR